MTTILLGEASPNKMRHAKVETEKTTGIEMQIYDIKLQEILFEILVLGQVFQREFLVVLLTYAVGRILNLIS
ncbi:hypothetical protein KUH03_02895 [Sphingobacterium sp. E70]|nr:hypothetical protein [Sphingobacterium sp. E70]ULT25943.1 hypothetical protein KUH03_02895 [Sphingobacterium sp. E70]